MGLVTYILIWNTQQGLKGSFNPEDLYYKLSSTLAFVCLDLLILKLGILESIKRYKPSFSLVELLCYVGYKFVPLILAQLLTNVTMPFNLNILIKFYLFIAFGVFLLRSVKFNLLSRSGAEDDDIHVSISKSTVKKCNYFLFVYGFIWQNVLMWLMGWSWLKRSKRGFNFMRIIIIYGQFVKYLYTFNPSIVLFPLHIEWKEK